MCGGVPPKPPGTDAGPEPDDEDVQDMLGDIEDMAMWHHAGSPPDFEQHPFEICRLFRQWIESEREIEIIREHRHAIYIKAQFKDS